MTLSKRDIYHIMCSRYVLTDIGDDVIGFVGAGRPPRSVTDDWLSSLDIWQVTDDPEADGKIFTCTGKNCEVAIVIGMLSETSPEALSFNKVKRNIKDQYGISYNSHELARIIDTAEKLKLIRYV